MQKIRGEVGVAEGHSEGRVTKEFLETQDISSSHYKVTSKSVSEVMESQGADASLLAGAGHCFSEVSPHAALLTWKDKVFSSRKV